MSSEDKAEVEPRVIKLRTSLTAKHIRDGKVIDERQVLDKVVTNAGRDFIVDAFQNLTEVDLFRFHASGTGTVAEAAADTALGTEVETRDSGTQIEGASSAVYRSVATHTYAATFAITEHGLFTTLALGGTLLDRTVFPAINVVSTDKIEFTFDITFASGG